MCLSQLYKNRMEKRCLIIFNSFFEGLFCPQSAHIPQRHFSFLSVYSQGGFDVFLRQIVCVKCFGQAASCTKTHFSYGKDFHRRLSKADRSILVIVQTLVSIKNSHTLFNGFHPQNAEKLLHIEGFIHIPALQKCDLIRHFDTSQLSNEIWRICPRCFLLQTHIVPK